MNTNPFYLFLLAIGCLFSSFSHAQNTVGLAFPECDQPSCGICKKVPISFSPSDRSSANLGYYSPVNVICVDNSPRSYLLTRCPEGFFDTFQNTSSVCKITATDGTGTDLLLRGDQLTPGLHPFDCLINHSDNVLSSVIVATDDNPYRDVLVYINGVLQLGYHNNTNITVNQGDNLAVVVRGVGNITKITASDPRFTCMTHFACNTSLRNGMSNRLLECSLHTPAEPNDNGRILTIIIDNTEQMQITITVNESVFPVASASHLQPINVAIATAYTGHEGPNIMPTIAPTSSSNVFSPFTIQTSAVPTFDEGTKGVPHGVVFAIIIAVVVAVVVILVLLGIMVYMHRKNQVHKKNLHNDTEKVSVSAPPTTYSKPASLIRSSIIFADGQQAGTLVTISEKLQKIEDKIDHNTERTEEQLQRIEDKAEEVNTGISALMTDNTRSLRRQTSAS